MDIIALKEHYEGVGINAVDITEAQRVIDSLFYSGEKKPHMWWTEFEHQLDNAFLVFEKREGRTVYSDSMKLCILYNMVQAEFLSQTKTTIIIELVRVPVTFTYAQAKTAFCNQVNLKFPPESPLQRQDGVSTNSIQEVVEVAEVVEAEAQVAAVEAEVAEVAEVTEMADVAVITKTKDVNQMLRWCKVMMAHTLRYIPHIILVINNGATCLKLLRRS